jgi:hypothetical protein
MFRETKVGSSRGRNTRCLALPKQQIHRREPRHTSRHILDKVQPKLFFKTKLFFKIDKKIREIVVSL